MIILAISISVDSNSNNKINESEKSLRISTNKNTKTTEDTKNDEKLALTIHFVRMMLIGIVFIGISKIMTSYLQIKGNFTVPGMIGYPNNIIIIISIAMSAIMKNINILAIGEFLGVLSQFLFQVPFAIKKGCRFKPAIDFKDKYLKKMLWLVVPVFIGVAVNQVNTMVGRSLVSGLGMKL